MIWRLKRNVVWHDGAPFTADDVIFNWEFALDPATAAGTRASYEDITRIERLDQYTIKVDLQEAAALLGLRVHRRGPAAAPHLPDRSRAPARARRSA